MNCFDCEFGLWCHTWGELKCVKKKQRMYRILSKDDCPNFKKREKGHILDTPCQCEDCMSIRGGE
jgi:hypothetical protein